MVPNFGRTSEGLEMKISIRMTKGLLEEIHMDLSRPHAFAHERVGFIACALSSTSAGGQLILASDYWPIADEDYERDPTVGAMMSSAAIRKALEFAYNHPVSMLHVHQHDHRGRPEFSKVDLSEGRKFVPDFWKVRPKMPHGLMVLSKNAATAAIWDPVTKEPRYVDEISIVGRPIMTFRSRR
jgi:hypothetical protein